MRKNLECLKQRWRLPMRCVFCKIYHQDLYPLCHLCIRELPTIGKACTVCRLPLADESHAYCGQCLRQRPYFDRLIAGYWYEEPLRSLLHAFKYRQATYLTALFVDLLCSSSTDLSPQRMNCLIPVPLHPKRLRARGFNQAAELAKGLSKRLDLPCILDACHRVIETPSQVALDKGARQSNVKGAFVVRPLGYENVTLVDDLVTTASTVNELAKVLKQQGVKSVEVLAFARTKLDKIT